MPRVHRSHSMTLGAPCPVPAMIPVHLHFRTSHRSLDFKCRFTFSFQLRVQLFKQLKDISQIVFFYLCHSYKQWALETEWDLRRENKGIERMLGSSPGHSYWLSWIRLGKFLIIVNTSLGVWQSLTAMLPNISFLIPKTQIIIVSSILKGFMMTKWDIENKAQCIVTCT